MILRAIILVFLVSGSYSAVTAATNKALDSLLSACKIHFFENGNSDSTLYYAKKGRELSEDTGSGEFFYKFCHLIANAHLVLGNFEEAKSEWRYAIKQRTVYKDFPTLGYIYTEYGQRLDMEGDSDAFFQYETAKEIFERFNDKEGLIGVMVNQALLAQQFAFTEPAFMTFLNANEMLEQEIKTNSNDNLKELRAIVHHNLAVLYPMLDSVNRFERALEHQDFAIRTTTDSVNLMSNYINLASILIHDNAKKDGVDSAYTILTRVIAPGKLDAGQRSTYHYVFGNYFEKKKNYKDALRHYLVADTLAIEFKSFYDQLVVTRAVKGLLRMMNDSQHASLFLKYDFKNDSLQMIKDSKEEKYNNILSRMLNPKETDMTIEKYIALLSGLIFMAFLAVVAVVIKRPLQGFSIFILRVIMAIAAAAFGAVIPGVLGIELKGNEFVIRASGAAAFFVFIYLFNPPGLSEDRKRKKRIAKPKKHKVTPDI